MQISDVKSSSGESSAKKDGKKGNNGGGRNGGERNINSRHLNKKNNAASGELLVSSADSISVKIQAEEKAKYDASDDISAPSSSPTLSSTPRRVRDSLAYLTSSLNPKYIGFTTPTHSSKMDMDTSSSERTRSARRRQLNCSAEVSKGGNDEIVVLSATTEVFGCLRRTQNSTGLFNNSNVSPLIKSYVSPIDKLLLKNGSISPVSAALDILESPKGRELERTRSSNSIQRPLRSSLRNPQTPPAASTALRAFQKVVNDESESQGQQETTENDDVLSEKSVDAVPVTEIADTKKAQPVEVSEDVEKVINLENDSNSVGQVVEDRDRDQCSTPVEPQLQCSTPVETHLQCSTPVEPQLQCSTPVEQQLQPESQPEILQLDDVELSNTITPSSEIGTTEFRIQMEKIDTDTVLQTTDVELVAASAKSPSAVSTDSAKGSSVINDPEWMSFSTGDLFWGQIYSYCYWPCMVCPDPEGKTITTEAENRRPNSEEVVVVHVRFFGDNGRRNWVRQEKLLPYISLESYLERVEEIRKLGKTDPKYKYLMPKQNKELSWHTAVKEANQIATVDYSDRLEKFYEIYEKTKEFRNLHRKRRQSMLVFSLGSTSDIGSLYDSTDNIFAKQLSVSTKRDRSVSPFSPAYSPVKKTAATKRRKITQEDELHGLLEPTGSECNYSHYEATNSISTRASSSSRDQQDDELFNDNEFRKFFKMMRDFVMEQNEDDKLEQSLIVAVRNIWALKQINHSQLQRSLTEVHNESYLGSSRVESIEGTGLRRLSNRLKTIKIRHSQPLPVAVDLNSSITQKRVIRLDEKPKNPLNRPIEEVIDDIFNLEPKYLFTGLTRDPVCKYCYRSAGKMERCSKGCQAWFHVNCASNTLKDNSSSNKAIKRSKVNNNNSIVSITSTTSTNTENGATSLSKPDIPIENNSKTLVHITAETSNVVNSASAVVHITAESEGVTHITAESQPIGDYVCTECKSNKGPTCVVCNSNDPSLEELVTCNMTNCGKAFHPACCKYWPQSKITKSKNTIESFRCPSHVCHTCVSDDPKRKFQHLRSSKLTKCVKCPASYHTDSTCIPAGSQILTVGHIICPRHSTDNSRLNVSWCFICVSGGHVVCCETCPTAVHATCLNIPIDPNEGYICEECESGRLPLYGEMVWAKFTHFRWWPAIILPPTEVPKNILRMHHEPSEFVVRFFGTHDHGWISRRRVYLYLEGDSSEPPKSKSHLDQSYVRGVEEAKRMYEIIKLKKQKQQLTNTSKDKLHPQPYVRIKANRAVHPVKLHIDLESDNMCNCSPYAENPCGPDTECLNRVLYHECNPKLCPAGNRCQNQMFESRVSPRLEVIYMNERGFGLVSGEPISAGTFVIEYVGEVINDDEFKERMKQKSIDRDENFYFFSVEKDYIIDAGPKGNLARFMNHSCDPNCETQKWSVNGVNRVGLFAIKDIPVNTELTFNYHWDDLLSGSKKTCYCGAAKCVGEIGGKYKEDKTKHNFEAVNSKTKSKSKAKSSNSKKTKPLKRLQKNVSSKSKKAIKINIDALKPSNLVAADDSIHDDEDGAKGGSEPSSAKD